MSCKHSKIHTLKIFKGQCFASEYQVVTTESYAGPFSDFVFCHVPVSWLFTSNRYEIALRFDTGDIPEDNDFPKD